ncbi:MAG: TolC family protein [Planctomycetota bacterium]
MLSRALAVVLPLALPPLALAQDAETPAQPPAQEPSGAVAGPVLELTLEDALRIALERNLTLELEAITTEIARYDYAGSWGTFDPTWTVGGSWTDATVEPQFSFEGSANESTTASFNTGLSVPFTTGGVLDLTFQHDNEDTNNQVAVNATSSTDVLTVALTQPLLRGAWKRFATTDQRESELGLWRQEARNEEIRQGVLRDVANAYWDLVGAAEQLGVREVALSTAQQQLDQDQRRLEVGVGTEVNVLQSETNVAQLEEQRLLAESNLRAAEDGLRALLFQRTENDLATEAASWDWPIVSLTPLPGVEAGRVPDWLASLELAVRDRPELAQQRFEIEASEVRLERARSNRLPGLDFNLSMRSRGFDSKTDEAFEEALSIDFPVYSAGLNFSLPLRNRTARFAERSAHAGVRAARITYDQIELTVLSEVRNAVRDLIYAGQNVAAASTSRDFAERQLAAEEARYQEGLSTTFQVLEFQRDLAEALSALTTARAGYAKALVALRHAEGGLRPPVEDDDATPLEVSE